MQLAKAQKIRITISESSLANLIYLSFEIYSLDHAAANLIDLLGGCELIHASSDVAIQALNSPFKDKEDALQYYTALSNGVDYFVTRNLKDYTHVVDQLPVISPQQFLKMVSEGV